MFCLLTWSGSHWCYRRLLFWIDLAPFFFAPACFVLVRNCTVFATWSAVFMCTWLCFVSTLGVLLFVSKMLWQGFCVMLLSSVDWMVLFILSVPVGVSYIDMYIHTPQQSFLSAVRLHSSCVICECTGSSVKFTSEEGCDGRSWRCLRDATFVIVITVC